MFWGLIMEPSRRYTQHARKSFRVTMASLDLSTSDDQPAQVMCGYEGRNYLLCTLKKPDLLQCPLDLEFAGGTEVSFASNGNAHIHLTGNLIESDDDPSLSDLEEEEEDEDEHVEEQTSQRVVKKKSQTSKSEDEPPSKKTKLSNGSIEEEEDESDDPDFEEEEAENEEDDDDDEDEDGESDDENEEAEDESDGDEEDEKQKKKASKLQKQKIKVQNGEQKVDMKGQQKKKQKKTLEKGVIIEDLVEGNGPVAKSGRFISVYYEGRLEKNNKQFDAMQKGPGFKFRLGGGEVIKGWDIGVAGMKVGGKRKIICPPKAGYGPKGSPPAIPPNSTLVFTVELKKVH